MSTTMIVCLVIIGICTLVIIVSKVYELIQTAKLEAANKLLSGLVPKGNITEHDGVKYEKWLPYCQDAFGFTKSFKCSKCDCVTEMPVLSDHSISYYAHCPHCGSAMLHRVDK